MWKIVLPSCGLLLAGCNAQFGGPALVSTQSPRGIASQWMPQPVNSLPRDAAGLGAGPTASVPNFASYTIHI